MYDPLLAQDTATSRGIMNPLMMSVDTQGPGAAASAAALLASMDGAPTALQLMRDAPVGALTTTTAIAQQLQGGEGDSSKAVAKKEAAQAGGAGAGAWRGS